MNMHPLTSPINRTQGQGGRALSPSILKTLFLASAPILFSCVGLAPQLSLHPSEGTFYNTLGVTPKSFTKTHHEHHVYVLVHVIKCVDQFLVT